MLLLNMALILISISLLPLAAVAYGLLVAKSIFLTFLLYHGMVCLLVPFLALRREAKPEALGLKGGNAKRSAVIGLGAGLVCAALVLVAGYYFADRLINGEKIAGLLSGWGLSAPKHPAFLIYFVAFNSLVEELFWRGYLWHEYNKVYRPLSVSLFISFFFIQYHILTVSLLFPPGAVLLFIPLIFAASLGWCYLRHKLGNVHAVVVSHLLADAGVIAVYLVYG